ncbi:BatA domain-containing protein, partial [Methylobacterium ajmalii]
MFGLPLGFAAPAALAALIALPALWYLLRVTPPRPRRIDFPPLRILADLLPERETPARTPPWLLALRLLAAACLILAVSGPVWNPTPQAASDGRAPLVLILDNGFSAAQDWRDRLRVATAEVEAAARAGRPVALLPTASGPTGIEATGPGPALERLRAIEPLPHLADRAAHLPALTAFLDKTPGSTVVWIHDGVAGPDGDAFPKGLA